MKKILIGDKVQIKLQKGINAIGDTVGITLGPRARKVGIDPNYQIETKLIIDDGFITAQNFRLEDPFEDFGAAMIRIATQRQVEDSGDGTSVTALLAQSIFNECLKVIAGGVNPQVIVRQLEEEKEKILLTLDKMSRPVKTLLDKTNVASVAVGDFELGKLIADTIHGMNNEGVVTVDEGNTLKTEVEKIEGMQFERGYISQYFITDGKRMEATAENCSILILDKNLSDIVGFKVFWDKVAAKGGSLVIVSPGFEGEVLPSFVKTKMMGGYYTLPVNPPLVGENQKQFLNDIAILTGGRVVGESDGSTFQNLDLDCLGHCDRVTQTKDSTMFVGGQGDKKEIEKRVASIKKELETEDSKYEIEKLQERIAKLSKGVAVIKAGRATDVEINSRKEKIKDAVEATKVAIEEGIVPGGEIALLNVSLMMKDNLLKNALKYPFKKLLENSGYDYAEMYPKLAEAGVNAGIDAKTGKVVDMFQAGIIDPVKVIKSAINNSFSVVSEAITMGALLIEVPEKQNDGK